jgi:hypothetical protein
MTQHDFNAIFDHYPELIEEMPNPFTSHQFILHLARRYQTLYIEALSFYRHSPNPQEPAPFQIVHGIFAKHLNAFPQLVTHIEEVESIDIFTQENRCAQWQKV